MGEPFVVDAAGLLTLANSILILIFLVMIIILWTKHNRVKRNYQRLLNGAENVNIENLLMQMQGKLNEQQEKTLIQEKNIATIIQHLKKMKSHVGIHRYNAFSDNGSDLSFSVAIMDEDQDGIVLTGIHSREQTYIYAKPIRKGQSSYTLSPEEKAAITQALVQPLQVK